MNRLPPQQMDAENAVIGGLMLDPEAFDEVFDLVTEEDFFKPANRKIFRAIQTLNKKGEPTDLITLSNHLTQNNILESLGGTHVLTDILNQTPSSANIKSCAKIVKNKSLLRRLIQVGDKVVDRAYKQQFEDIEDFFSSVESEIFSVTERKTNRDLLPVNELVKESMKRLDLIQKANKGEVIGLPSGFIELDRLTSGFQPGELTIIAARPSMGKTALSLNIALHAAIREKKKVAYFSLEMSKEQLMLRLLSSEGEIVLNDLRVAQMNKEGWDKLVNTATKLNDSSLFIDDSSALKALDVLSKSRKMKAKHGLDLIVIDYLQLMGVGQRAETREREVSEISRMLKGIAKELDVPLISLAQLNRGVEARSDRRPMLSDLRESGSIEQDADIILMIYREDYYDKENLDLRGVAELIMTKQRNGPIGSIKLGWKPEYGLFLNDVEGSIGPALPFDQEESFPSFDGSSVSKSEEKKPKERPLKNYAPKPSPPNKEM